ncbi:MAG: ribosome-associated translation inhibitor RaiA [Candidatus Kerfeldbacteria bacterium]|nr:ribosome-associated translation inhibitor RaiA [Candidatus Kerfeldbacteria bacterium]
MNITLTGKNIEVTEAMRAYVEEKIGGLTKYGEDISRVDVEVDKNMHHKKGGVFHVRANVQVLHELLHSEVNEAEFYAAVDVCRAELMNQLEHYTAKKDDKHRRAQKSRRDWKSILAFWK